MIIMYGGNVLPLPGATQMGRNVLVSTMHFAVQKWIAEGRPNSEM